MAGVEIKLLAGGFGRKEGGVEGGVVGRKGEAGSFDAHGRYSPSQSTIYSSSL